MEEEPWENLKTVEQGRFAKVISYLDGVTPADLDSLDENALLEHVPSEDRLLLRLLCRQYLFAPLPPAPPPPLVRVDWSSLIDTESGTPQITAKRAKSDASWSLVDDSIADPSMTTISKFKESMIWLKDETQKFISLNLSSCRFIDSSLKSLCNIVKEHLPNVEEVNLSYNGLSPRAWRYLNDFLSLLKLKRIIIVGNPMATIASKENFIELGKEIERLIWIPQSWLVTGRWKSHVSLDQEEIVKRAHEAFYASRKSNGSPKED